MNLFTADFSKGAVGVEQDGLKVPFPPESCWDSVIVSAVTDGSFLKCKVVFLTFLVRLYQECC